MHSARPFRQPGVGVGSPRRDALDVVFSKRLAMVDGESFKISTVQRSQRGSGAAAKERQQERRLWWVVREVFMIHVGGTRCVTSSTDNILKRHFRITWNVECIRGYIFTFLFDV